MDCGSLLPLFSASPLAGIEIGAAALPADLLPQQAAEKILLKEGNTVTMDDRAMKQEKKEAK